MQNPLACFSLHWVYGSLLSFQSCKVFIGFYQNSTIIELSNTCFNELIINIITFLDDSKLFPPWSLGPMVKMASARLDISIYNVDLI